MLSFLSQWLPSALVSVLMISISVGILLLRIRADLHRGGAADEQL